LVWDGKDATGQVVTGGVFTSYQLRTIDKKGAQVVAAESVFDLNAGGVDLRGMDPRVLAMRPVASGAVQPIVPPAPRETAPVLTEMPQPQGRRGSIRLPAILFEAHSSVLRDLYRPFLDQVADLIRKFPRVQVYIEGHADAEGTPWEAVKLSQERADAVLRYLLEEKHLSPEYLYARGHGQSAPLESEPTEKAHAMNRRVEIVILTQ
jgi:outer membrane protein OmpA-like peptidoglycan-associated protein